MKPFFINANALTHGSCDEFIIIHLLVVAEEVIVIVRITGIAERITLDERREVATRVRLSLPTLDFGMSSARGRVGTSRADKKARAVA